MLNKYYLWQLYNIYIDVLIIWEKSIKPLILMQMHTSFHPVLITPKTCPKTYDSHFLHSFIILIKAPPEQLSAWSSQWSDRNMSIPPQVMVPIICSCHFRMHSQKLQQQIKMHERHEQTWPPHTSISFFVYLSMASVLLHAENGIWRQTTSFCGASVISCGISRADGPP